MCSKFTNRMEEKEIIKILGFWNFWRSNPKTGIRHQFNVNKIETLLEDSEIPIIIETQMRSYFLPMTNATFRSKGMGSWETMLYSFIDDT